MERSKESEERRSVDPTQALLALQSVVTAEASRFYMEIAMREAYILQLQDYITELEEKISNGQG